MHRSIALFRRALRATTSSSSRRRSALATSCDMNDALRLVKCFRQVLFCSMQSVARYHLLFGKTAKRLGHILLHMACRGTIILGKFCCYSVYAAATACGGQALYLHLLLVPASALLLAAAMSITYAACLPLMHTAAACCCCCCSLLHPRALLHICQLSWSHAHCCCCCCHRHCRCCCKHCPHSVTSTAIS
jgi:hypothetical protein